jgi:hypothetical protein
MNLVLLITTSIAWILYAVACIISLLVILYCKKTDELYKKFEKFLILRDDEDKMFLLFGNTIVYLATFALIGTFTYSYLIYHDILNKAAVLMALEISIWYIMIALATVIIKGYFLKNEPADNSKLIIQIKNCIAYLAIEGIIFISMQLLIQKGLLTFNI